jgi:multicomponent Na+:H+ antiporter subunit B
MSERARRTVFLVGAAGVAVLLLWGMFGLPDFGTHESTYAKFLNATTVARRHVTDVVTATVFDYRGIDTLGEELLLFAAVVGTAMLLREQREERDQRPSDQGLGRVAVSMSSAVRLVGVVLIGPAVVFGSSIIAHGHLSPGGGFQGGVMLASVALLAYLVGEYRTLERSAPWAVTELSEGAGAAAYAAVGVLGLLGGAAFLENVLPLGQAGSLASGGTILAGNVAVGLAVSGAMVVLFREFLHQTLVVRRARARAAKAA